MLQRDITSDPLHTEANCWFWSIDAKVVRVYLLPSILTERGCLVDSLADT